MNSARTHLYYDNKSDKFQMMYKAALDEMNTGRFGETNRRKLAMPLKETLLSCKFNQKRCTSSDFKWEWDSYWGNCYVFNTEELGSLKKSQYSGVDYGLTVEMRIDFDERLNEFNAYTRNARGGIVHISNNSFRSNDHSNNIALMPGMRTYISVERAFKLNMPKPYSNCDVDNESPGDFNSELYAFLLSSDYQYSQQLCFTQCKYKLAFIYF